MSQKVIILKGLPGSGKTTWAKEQVDKNPEKFKRINKDDLREMLDNSKYSKNNEEFIIKTHDKLLYWAVQDGYTVIVDNTNLTQHHENRVREIVGDKAIVEIKEFNTPLEECIERDKKRANSIGEKAIRDLHNKFIKIK